MTDINSTITLTIHTCPCGTCYALPHWITVAYKCPMCAHRSYMMLQERYDERYEEKCRLERVVRGLRGALKQGKGRK